MMKELGFGRTPQMRTETPLKTLFGASFHIRLEKYESRRQGSRVIRTRRKTFAQLQ